MSAPVSQADRNAAAECHAKSCYEIVRIQGVQCRNGYADEDYLVQAFARHRIAAEATIRAECAGEVAAMKAEVERLREKLRKADEPYWYYPAGDGESPSDCLYELIDYIDYAAGEYVLEVDTARPSRKIWCAVRVTGDEYADERFTFTEHDSEEAARAALGEKP